MITFPWDNHPQCSEIDKLYDHFAFRAMQRYQIAVTPDLFWLINETIRDGISNDQIRVQYHGRVSKYRTRWWVQVEGVTMLVVYTRRVHAVITALPKLAREIRYAPIPFL